MAQDVRFDPDRQVDGSLDRRVNVNFGVLRPEADDERVAALRVTDVLRGALSAPAIYRLNAKHIPTGQLDGMTFGIEGKRGSMCTAICDKNRSAPQVRYVA